MKIHHDPVVARYHELEVAYCELEVAYRELRADYMEMVAQFDKIRAEMRACWAELERLRGMTAPKLRNVTSARRSIDW